VADTLYLLIITNRKDKVKEKKKKRKREIQGNKRRRNREKTYSCTFTPWSYPTVRGTLGEAPSHTAV